MINLFSNNEFSFFWLDEKKISGSSIPTSINDIQYLYDKGIKNIISTQSADNVNKLIKNAKLEIDQFALPIKDFSTPNASQLKDFIIYLNQCFKKKETVVIHCYAGCGRTGVLLMIYLLVFTDLNYEDALKKLRQVRSCAVETKMQQIFLKNLDIENLKKLLTSNYT